MGFRSATLESVRRGAERFVKRGLADAAQLLGVTVVDAVRGHVADARMAMHDVVPGEEGLAVGPCVLDAAEARGEVGPVLQRLELRLGVRVVVRDIGPAVALGDVRSTSSAATGLERMLVPRSACSVSMPGSTS